MAWLAVVRLPQWGWCCVADFKHGAGVQECVWTEELSSVQPRAACISICGTSVAPASRHEKEALSVREHLQSNIWSAIHGGYSYTSWPNLLIHSCHAGVASQITAIESSTHSAPRDMRDSALYSRPPCGVASKSSSLYLPEIRQSKV